MGLLSRSLRSLRQQQQLQVSAQSGQERFPRPALSSNDLTEVEGEDDASRASSSYSLHAHSLPAPSLVAPPPKPWNSRHSQPWNSPWPLRVQKLAPPASPGPRRGTLGRPDPLTHTLLREACSQGHLLRPPLRQVRLT